VVFAGSTALPDHCGEMLPPALRWLLPAALLWLAVALQAESAVRCSVHPLDPPGPSHPGSGFAAVACAANVTEQLWTLSVGVTPGDSKATSVGQWHPTSTAGGCWEIQGCSTAEDAVVNTNWGCKAVPVKPCKGNNDCLCAGAWSINSNSTITSVMDGRCLQVDPGSTVTVGSCTGKANQQFKFIKQQKRAGDAGYVWSVQQGGRCVQGAPPAPAHCASYTTAAACPTPRCSWNSNLSHCVDPTPPVEKCLTPKWTPTYNMSLSTVIMPCNYQELMSDGPFWPTIREFGLISIDWSNSKSEWVNTDPMTCEENLVKQAQLIKANNPLGAAQKVWVYRNTVIAYPWMTSMRKIMDDPAHDVWFLKYRNATHGDPSPLSHDGDGAYKNPQCDHNFKPPKCTNLFHSLTQTPGYPHGDGNCDKPCDCGRLPCGFYLFDQTQWNTSVNGRTLREWMVRNLTVSPTGMLSPYVSGFYIDDYWSTSMHGGAGGANDLDGSEVHDIGLSGQDVANQESSWVATMDVVKQAILDAGGFTWQMMVNNGHGSGSALWYRVMKGSGCAAQLRAACQPDSLEQVGALNYDLASGHNTSTMSLIDFDEHLASFLLIRGPFAWVGYSWISCSVPYARPPQLDTDWGVPLGLCKETGEGTGVFTRSWSKADVKLDCGAWEGSVTPR
jgi:hypothetical protein